MIKDIAKRATIIAISKENPIELAIKIIEESTIIAEEVASTLEEINKVIREEK